MSRARAGIELDVNPVALPGVILAGQEVTDLVTATVQRKLVERQFQVAEVGSMRIEIHDDQDDIASVRRLFGVGQQLIAVDGGGKLVRRCVAVPDCCGGYCLVF